MKFSLFITMVIVAFQFEGYCQKIDPKQSEQILQIRYDVAIGGKYGGYKHMVLTKDSIFYNSETYINGIVIKLQVSNKYIHLSPDLLWPDLVASVNVHEFDKIKNGELEIPNDGVDEYISIQTPNKLHSEVNGDIFNTNTNTFKVKLINIMSRLKDFF